MNDLNLNLDGLFPDELVEVSNALHTLAAYAKLKARAMRDRAQGNLNDAIAQEATCEQFYKTLPPWAKW